MPIDFHSERNRFTYASREVDASWLKKIKDLVEVSGKRALDLACGGGIYSKGLVQLGASHVTGLDFSKEVIAGARVNCQGIENVEFVEGNVFDTGLPDEEYDLILQRALIHHLDEAGVKQCLLECKRLLRKGGVLIIQNRTPEDCLLPGSNTHIRGYFFERYPKLSFKEVKRRYPSDVVMNNLRDAGFTKVEEHMLWETRKIYYEPEQLSNDLLQRTGRSLLHELTDEELANLVSYIELHLLWQVNSPIIEKDRWTIWRAVK
ncbi:class I SAM-dependent methyltransferase [Paenibacillus medicaginis]|uniref:Class I SAM-dependent methyltransferase n=1 Tax=Paenibacillus medicaginis TaxID=1470560 RepID=A0ABV5C7C7_9BACL